MSTNPKASKKFFTSDWHHGEQPTPNTHSFLRPEPNEILVPRWLQQCQDLIQPDDELIFLGDISITLDDFAEVGSLLPKCRKTLVLGDKEYASKLFSREDFLAKNKELGIFDAVVDDMTVKIGDQEWFLTHKPVDCLAQPLPALCGHIHGIWRTQKMPNGQPIINVGIDAWHGLVTEEFIAHQYNAVTKPFYDGNCFPVDWK